MKIGFVGLGNMGLPMSLNLSKSGHEVTGFDVFGDAMSRASSEGLTTADNILGVASDKDVFITMLPSGSDVLGVYGETLEQLDSSTLVIDCSTIDVVSAREAHKLASSKNLDCLDAPVSGGIMGAVNGTLAFMVGGSAESFARAEPVLEPMSAKVVHCGDAGAGQAAKVCNNMVLGATMIVTCEAFALGRRLGLKDQALFDVISNASGQSWSTTTYCPVPGPVPTSPANNDYRAGFSVNLMNKDLGLARRAAESVEASVPLGEHAGEIYNSFADEGFGEMDFSGIIKKFE